MRRQLPGTRDVTVTIRPGENQACTFTNTLTPDGAIHLSKVTVGGVGRTAFVIESLGAEPADYHQVAIDSRTGVPADAVPDGDANRTDHIPLLAAKRAGGFNLHATVGTAGDDPRLSDNISDERIYIRPSTPKPPTPPVGCGSVELRAPLPDC